MREATVNIVRDIIEGMTPQSAIYSIIETSTGSHIWEIEFCNSLWVRPNSKVTIGGTEYKVLSIDYVEYTFTVGSTLAPSGAYFTLPVPFYFHGTPENVNKELVTLKLPYSKFPMIYLYENFREKIVRDELSSIERESALTFCFLDEASFENWTTDDFLYKAQLPMMQLADYFIQELEDSPRVGLLEDGSQAYPSEFNIVITRNGKKETTFTDPLSGCVLEQTIPFMKQDCVC